MNFRSILVLMTRSINSERHSIKFKELISLMQADGLLSTLEVVLITGGVNSNMRWHSNNMEGIANWFDERE